MVTAAEWSIEPGRGVYDAHRAAALSGVPISTLHYWARTGLYAPSISPGPRSRLWSWSDLLALRAIDWFRKGDEHRARSRVAKLREALYQIEQRGYSRDKLSQLLAVSAGDGQLFLQLSDETIRADGSRQLAINGTLYLVKPYKNGPDLLQPRPLLRIIPGKLHGEPHIIDTRIPSLTIGSLAQQGFDLSQIQAMYPDAPADAIQEAIGFERSLALPLAV